MPVVRAIRGNSDETADGTSAAPTREGRAAPRVRHVSLAVTTLVPESLFKIPVFGDRFIARRSGVDPRTLRSKIFSSPKTIEDIFKQCPNSWRHTNYRGRLQATLARPGRLLDTAGVARGGQEAHAAHWDVHEEMLEDNRAVESSRAGWPCAPRKCRLAGLPEVVFDLPGYKDNMQYDVLDWGQRDFLVAALDMHLFVWDSTSNTIQKIHTFSDDFIMVAKWNIHGTSVAVGTVKGHVIAFDILNTKMIEIPSIFHRAVEENYPSITALSWEPAGTQLVCCTETGTINVLPQLGLGPSRRGAHRGEIVNCSYSPDSRFLVTCGADCFVRVWLLPDLQAFFQIIFTNPARAIAWHPWRGCQLAVGGGLGAGRGFGDGSLSFWNVGRQTNICHELPAAACAVDALAFNRLTAELTVSYWVDEVRLGHGGHEEAEGHSRLMVLSAPGRATDELVVPPGRIRALLFSPDGTKLGSASSDENLFIWNFLGNQSPLLNMYKRKSKKSKLCLKTDSINEFNNFGYYIR